MSGQSTGPTSSYRAIVAERDALKARANGLETRLVMAEATGICLMGICSIECNADKPCNDGNPCTDD